MNKLVLLPCLILLWGCANQANRLAGAVQYEEFKSCNGKVVEARDKSVDLPVLKVLKDVALSVYSCEYVLGEVIRRPFSSSKLKLANGKEVRSGFGYALLDFPEEVRIETLFGLAVERFRDPKKRFKVYLKHKSVRVNGDVLPVTLIKIKSARMPIKQNVAALSLYPFSLNGYNSHLFMWTYNYPLTEEKAAERFGLLLQFVNEY